MKRTECDRCHAVGAYRSILLPSPEDAYVSVELCPQCRHSVGQLCENFLHSEDCIASKDGLRGDGGGVRSSSGLLLPTEGGKGEAALLSRANPANTPNGEAASRATLTQPKTTQASTLVAKLNADNGINGTHVESRCQSIKHRN